MSLKIKRLLILEDQPEAFQLLHRVVNHAIDSPLIEHAQTLASLDSFDFTQYDLLLVDLRLPDGLSIDFIKRVKQAFPSLPAIVTTLYADDDLVFAALGAGADGYLLKSDGEDSLIQRLQRMLSGEPPISPAIARMLMRQFNVQKKNTDHDSTNRHHDRANTGEVHNESSKIDCLTPREIDVLILIAKGLMTKQVASELSLSRHTINDVIKSIYKKLGIRTRSEATLHATRSGLI